ncbi:MAG: dicarboxylate/amino acid:cation symporter [Bacteroidota bacterium]
MLKRVALHWQILTGLVIGVAYGAWLPEYVSYVGWLGVLFLRALNMVIVPVILFSIISGVTSVGSADNLGRIGLKTMSFYMITSLIAIVTGLVLVNFTKPGIGADIGLIQKVEGLSSTTQSIGETLLNIVPKNIFQAFANGEMLAIIFFAILFGFFIMKVKEKPQQIMIGFFNAGLDVVMEITMFIIRFAPLGIFGIVANQVSQVPDLGILAQRLGIYMMTVIAALLIHMFITLSLSLKLLANVNPLRHLKNMSVPILTAFSTSSSNATLPLSIEAVEHKSGVSNKIASFTLPLGATINMNGTALYECVAVMFIAQAYGIDLSFSQQMVVVFTALLAAIGSAGIPMAGLVMMAIVMNAVGLPLEGIGLILAVDRILDMFRTVVNVYGDTCGAVVVARSEGEIIKS